MLDEYSEHVAHVNLLCSHHCFDVSPIFAAVVETFKYGKIVTTQEGELSFCDRMVRGPDDEVLVEVGGVEKNINRNVFVEESVLTLVDQNCAIVLVDRDAGWQSRQNKVKVGNGRKDIEINIDRCSGFTRTPHQRKRTTEGMGNLGARQAIMKFDDGR